MSDARSTFTIGSDVSCDLVLADETVAPRHAQLEVRANGPLILSDCGQAPQTKVVHHGEARPVRRAVVTEEDRVRFGDLELSVPELIEALDLDRRLPGWRASTAGAAAAAAAAASASGSGSAGGSAGAGAGVGVGDRPAADLPPLPGARGQGVRGLFARSPAVASASGVAWGGVGGAASRPPIAEPEALLLPCARCGRMTDSLKRHRLHRWVLFVWIAWWAQTADYTACPPCMRAILVRRTLANLPGANLAWPVIALINAWHFAATFRRGHGKRVKELAP
jgi:hypothetical protein